MLHEPTKRVEVRAASAESLRAAVDLVCVKGAAEVLVERLELAERALAQDAFVRSAVEGSLRGIGSDGRGRLPVAIVGDELRAVYDNAVFVVLHSELVDHLTRDARMAPARLEMEHDTPVVDEGLVAFAARAPVDSGLVNGGIEVLVKGVLGLEKAIA